MKRLHNVVWIYDEYFDEWARSRMIKLGEKFSQLDDIEKVEKYTEYRLLNVKPPIGHPLQLPEGEYKIFVDNKECMYMITHIVGIYQIANEIYNKTKLDWDKCVACATYILSDDITTHFLDMECVRAHHINIDDYHALHKIEIIGVDNYLVWEKVQA